MVCGEGIYYTLRRIRRMLHSLPSRRRRILVGALIPDSLALLVVVVGVARQVHSPPSILCGCDGGVAFLLFIKRMSAGDAPLLVRVERGGPHLIPSVNCGK